MWHKKKSLPCTSSKQGTHSKFLGRRNFLVIINIILWIICDIMNYYHSIITLKPDGAQLFLVSLFSSLFYTPPLLLAHIESGSRGFFQLMRVLLSTVSKVLLIVGTVGFLYTF